MTTSETSQEPWVNQTIAHMASLLRGEGGLSIGDVASLRRMDPYRPPSAFFKLEALTLDGHAQFAAPVPPSAETRWAAIVVGLAHLSALHQGGLEHRLGRVLAERAYAEVRFTRLLAADAERLVDELPMLARYLASKGCQVDWTGAARLMLAADHPEREEYERRRLARDYYGTLARQGRDS